MQIAAQGRTAYPDVLKRTGHALVSPGDIPMKEGDPAPMMLSREDMYRYLKTFTEAAKNAVLKAGFDGVEVSLPVTTLASRALAVSPFREA